MRYDSIPVSLFENNRKRFVAKMQNNSLAILTSNDVMPNNADDVMGFAQKTICFICVELNRTKLF